MPKTTVPVPTRVLVLGMVAEDGTIDAADVYAVAEACGQTPEQVRSCLRRLVAESLFVQQGRGASARFEATAGGLATMGSTIERTRLAYAQDAAGSGWDRRWRLVAFAIPESRRAARDSLRDHLVALGGASIQGGLYVSPHAWHKDVKAEAERLGVESSLTLAVADDIDVGGVRDPRDVVRALWPVDDLARDYTAFVERFRPMLDALRTLDEREGRLQDAAFLPGAFHMAVAFQACFDRDPLLPPELLPRPWPGRSARDLVVKSRRLALALREKHGRPSLFRLFDEAIETLP